MTMKKKIAVFFGGRSPEHDVSTYTGLQEVFKAVDQSQYDPFPVYIAPHGGWFIGHELLKKENYIFSHEDEKKLTPVSLDLNAKGFGRLLPQSSKLFRKTKPIEFDIALPAFHGLFGEDGNFQGLMEFANIPYAGMRAKACAVFMDKDSTKKAFEGSGIPILPYATINRPENGFMPDKNVVKDVLKKITLPCIVKPANLGSSIGVGKAETVDEVREILGNLFRYDTKAILEPFVENMIEYNVALRVNEKNEIETSAIERPRTHEELLDFKEKYLSGGGKKNSSKQNIQGMLAMTRDINPELTPEQENNIRNWSVEIFSRYDPAGAPRIDFIGNQKTGEIWFNELNPIPGSYGYFLWEAAKNPILFVELINGLLSEAEKHHKLKQVPHDPVPEDARLFDRPL